MANPLLSTNSNSANFNQVNTLIREVNNDQKIRVIKDDTGTPVVILDKNGLRTTKVGASIDVTKATASQLTFNSAQNVFKVVTSGTTVISCPANTTQTTSIAHSLGYVPIIMAYIETGSGNYPVPAVISFTRDDVNHVVINAAEVTMYADINNIYIRFINALSTAAPSSGTYNFKYYVLQETAS